MPDFHLDNPPTVRDVQAKILVIGKFFDALCRKNGIEYTITAGTGIGALRHGGFIPWDDDLDVFMTPDQYAKFRETFLAEHPADFVLQEWFVADSVFEYAKIRLNGTTYVEEVTKDRLDIHQGIFIDIFPLHKVPPNRLIRAWIYVLARFATLYAISKRYWRPKNKLQALVLRSLKFLPCRPLANLAYHWVCKYDRLDHDFMYISWLNHSNYKKGLLKPEYCSPVGDIPFEDTRLMGALQLDGMLTTQFGDYMTPPPEDARREAVHAMFVDTERDYTRYFQDAMPVNGCLQIVPLLAPHRPKRP